MPNWKKVVVSGSDAALSSLNVTGNVTAGTLTGNGSGVTNVTAASVAFTNISERPTLVSASGQINHNTTTNYVADQHVAHSNVSISAGSGLSGGGTIAANRTLTLDTSSTHFTGGVKSKLSADQVLSGSVSSPSQGTINVGGFTNIDLGLQTGDSPQFTAVTATNFTGTASRATVVDKVDVLSGGATTGLGIYSGSFSGSFIGNIGGGGSVTSVGLSLPNIFTVSNSPVTSTGTLTAVLASQTQNTFLAAPNGSSGTPTFRTIVAADIPTLNQNTTGQAGSVANAVTFNNAGSGDASGTTYNGSAARTISYNTIGAAAASHTHAISEVTNLQTTLDGKLGTSAKAADSNLLDGYDSLAFSAQNSVLSAADFQYGGIGLSTNNYTLSSATTDTDQHGRYYYTGTSGQIITRYIPVDKSGLYRMKIRWKTSAASSTYIAVFLLDTSGNNINGAGTYWAYPWSGTNSPTSWTESEYWYSGASFPSNAAYVAFGISHTNYTGGGATYYVSQLEIERVNTTISGYTIYHTNNIPTWNQNTTGTAANVTGTVAIANGGTGAVTAPAARTALGATTVGSNFFTLTNPGAISFIRINADNTISALNGAGFREAINVPTRTGGDASGTWAITASLATTATTANATAQSITFNNAGSGAATGTTYNGSIARTISYNTIGAAAASHTHAISEVTNLQTALDGKLGTGAKAADSELLDGNDSTVFLRQLSGGTEANIDTYTDNGFRTVGYTGFSKHLLSWNAGGSPGTVQQEFDYSPGRGWRVRMKTDNTSWTSWGWVLMTDTNSGVLSATTVGKNFFTLTNPGAIGFIRVNADNTVSALNGAGFREAINVPTRTGGDASGTWNITAANITSQANSATITAATAATANTIALRDGSGDITTRYFFGSYFNQSQGNSENPTIGQIWTQNTTDNYVRKSTPAHFINQLNLMRYAGVFTGNFQDLTDSAGELRIDQVDNINAGGYSNQPPNVYTYGGVLSWRTVNHSFQLYASHTGDITFKTQWNNDNYSGWRRILHESNYNSFAPSLTGGGASGTWGINITGNAGTITSQANSATISATTGVDANNIVRRDGNGYIYANHINFNTSESENPAINSFITSNGDGWSRKSTLDHAKNSIRGVADGTWGINITGNSATTSQRSFSGTLTGEGDVRAPIFYDNSNTGYYVDPASNTNLYGTFQVSGAHGDSQIGVRMLAGNNGGGGGEINLRMWVSEPGITWNWGGFGYNVTNNNGSPAGFGRLNTSHGQAYMRFSDGGDLYFYNTNPSGTRSTNMEMYSSGYVYVNNYLQSGNSLRAPIFYDSNNTGYYTDQASTSNYNALFSYSYQGNGNVGGTGNASWHPSGIYSAGYNWLYGGINGGGASGTNFSDLRANIFYDYSDTSYYVDPNSTGASIRTAGDIVAYYSDERLKDIEHNIENALEKVLSLDGFFYTPNELAQSLGYKKKREVGLSAQQVEKILPEIIKEAPINPLYKTLDYSRLVPLLVEAIKEQQQKIQELEKVIKNN